MQRYILYFNYNDLPKVETLELGKWKWHGYNHMRIRAQFDSLEDALKVKELLNC